ncbi:MAG: calcineurin-like phosphoesterase C-terminal domain-containing protein, partial [Candidatus Cryptobacteroides sp.]
MVCEFSSISDRYVTVVLPDNFSSGTYKIYVTRGSQRKLMGEAVIFIDFSSSTDINLKDGNNVYGKVTCEGTPIPNVVISDGVQVVTTDDEGVYQFKSDKVNGWVFVSVPGGYAVKKNGILPSFYSLFTMPAGTPEKVDFELVREDGQDNHTMIYIGDLHLADRNDDRIQFSRFTSEINSYLMTNGGHKVYGITLGDMTWDLYWYSNNYCFSEYLNDISVISGMPIWHTIGNHDHDMNQAGDYDTVIKYKNSLGPTYFSFNIGQVHYVILDNIYCTNKGDGSRTYDDKITQEQLDWLKKDLAKIQTSTPVVVCMHAPIYSMTGSNSLNNASALEAILLPYSTVHIFTGHSHRVHNIDKTASKHIFEHNAGAVCATWWWSAKLTPGIHIGQDGAPGGYEIVDVTGKDFKWTFKATGADANHQFRTYDRNCISLSGNSCIPNAFEANRTKFDEYAKDWKAVSNANEVYINIWDYDEEWTVDVTENGKALKVERVSICDPLHLVAYTAPAM